MRPNPLNYEDMTVLPDGDDVVLTQTDAENALFRLTGLSLDDPAAESSFRSLLGAFNAGVQTGYEQGFQSGVQEMRKSIAGALGIASADAVDRMEAKLDALMGAGQQGAKVPTNVLAMPAVKTKGKGSKKTTK